MPRMSKELVTLPARGWKDGRDVPIELRPRQVGQAIGMVVIGTGCAVPLFVGGIVMHSLLAGILLATMVLGVCGGTALEVMVDTTRVRSGPVLHDTTRFRLLHDVWKTLVFGVSTGAGIVGMLMCAPGEYEVWGLAFVLTVVVPLSVVYLGWGLWRFIQQGTAGLRIAGPIELATPARFTFVPGQDTELTGPLRIRLVLTESRRLGDRTAYEACWELPAITALKKEVGVPFELEVPVHADGRPRITDVDGRPSRAWVLVVQGRRKGPDLRCCFVLPVC